jgi:hypothetical protein
MRSRTTHSTRLGVVVHHTLFSRFLKVRAGHRVESFPRLGIVVLGNATRSMVPVVAVIDIRLPRHGLLARGFDYVSDVAGNIARSIVDGTILGPRSPNLVRKDVLPLHGRIKVRARKKSIPSYGRVVDQQSSRNNDQGEPCLSHLLSSVSKYLRPRCPSWKGHVT